MAQHQHIKIAVVGGSGVGKTSFIRRFARNEFNGLLRKKCARCMEHMENDSPSHQRINDQRNVPRIQESRSMGVLQASGNARLYCEMLRKRCTCKRPRLEYKTIASEGAERAIHLTHISVMDVPAMTSFPEDTLQEFATEGARGISTAAAFILVFDVTKRESFEHIKQIRSEIKERCLRREETMEQIRSSVMLWKVGTHEEVALNSTSKPTSRTIRKKRASKTPNNTNRIFNTIQEDTSSHTSSGYSDTTYQNTLSGGPVEASILIVGAKADLLENDHGGGGRCAWYKDAVYTVKKTWKHPYVPCSAKYGVNVNAAFLAAVDSVLAARGRRKKTRGNKRS